MKDLEPEGIDVQKLLEIKQQLDEPGMGELKIIENQFLPDNVVVVSTRMMKALKLPKIGNIIPEK